MAAEDRRSRVQLGLDGAFGLVLPIVCFGVDAFGLHVYGGATSAARVFVAIELLLFTIWHLRRPRSAVLNAFFGGVFACGAGFALITGVVLFPSTVIGCIAVIGLLGVVPFGTCVIYCSLTSRALRPSWNDSAKLASAMAFALGALLPVAPFVAIRAYERQVAHHALEAFDASSTEASRILRQLPSCDTSRLYGLRDGTFARHDLEKWRSNSWPEELLALLSF